MIKLTKKLSFIILLYLFNLNSVYAAAYQYEARKMAKHVIHVVTLNPKDYKINLVKAHNAEIARETVASMAKRSNAQIAINGGFFSMEPDTEGAPSGSLVVNGKVYKVKNQRQALALFQAGNLSIQLANTKELVNNYFKKNKRSELSLVSGIPLLINQGQIVPEVFNKKSAFYAKPHARTALGLRQNGTIVITVSEHPYAIPFLAMLMGERQGNVQGLTMIELAKIMKELGCEFAINLDGGGSSTLWIDGKIINNTVGDEDEGKGLQIARSVSDAIVFRKIKG